MVKKQAILLIHGIGEQRPMDTLRGFVRAVWSEDTGVHHEHVPPTVWSKPDTISGNFELRRLTTGQNRNAVRTDFFEFYWAHLMSDTRPWHVASWAKTLLVRRPRNVPAALRGLWCLIMASACIIVGLSIWMATLPNTERWTLLENPLLSGLIGVALPTFVGAFVIQYIGDAARYLHGAATNIEQRSTIRAKGVELLKKLHESDEYDRIVVVGHSLGSVIGYDVLTYLWTHYNNSHDATPHPETQALKKLEELVRDSELDLDTYQGVQKEYFEELRNNGNKWLVTDFVTLGSPLTYATMLLAGDEEQLLAKHQDRELPTCPPMLEGQDEKRTFCFGKKTLTPHHAAVFAPTRWTNLYFPARLMIWGDVISGPLRPVFGNGIRDVAVSTRVRRGFLSHTCYWRLWRDKDSTDSIQKLRDVINLACD